MAHMFACARYISIAGHTMREGKWEKKAYGKGIELQGQDARHRRLRPHRPASGRHGKGHRHERHRVRYLPHAVRHAKSSLASPTSTLDELLAKSDFISVHAPAVDGGALINADTHLQDEGRRRHHQHLPRYQRRTRMRCWPLWSPARSAPPVWTSTPTSPLPTHALYSHPMVSCTPHIGAATVEAQKRIGAEIVDIITNFKA